MQSGARQLKHCLFLLTLLLVGLRPAWAEPHLRLTSSFVWSQNDTWFGGFSGAEINADGTEITLVTDKGVLLTARIQRVQDAIRSIQVNSTQMLKEPDGTELIKLRNDAEGLAIGPDGTFVSFEHVHRVARIDRKSGRIAALIGPETAFRFPLNGGLEALAMHPDGRLFTLPERSGDKRQPFPLYVQDQDQWRIIAKIPRRGPFRPVGADFDADGRFFLLERAVSPLGFRSRLRLFDLSQPNLAEQTLLTTGPGQYDNLEALTLWQDKTGATRITLISDDNFMRVQRTQIVEFTLTQ